MRLFRVITGEEEPIVGRPLTGMTQVKIHSRHQQLERYFQMTGPMIDTDETDGSVEILLIRVDRYILGISDGDTKPGAGDNIFGIFRSKGRGMVTGAIRNFQYFFSSESCQIDPGYPRCIIRIGKEPAAIRLSIGLRKFQVMLIIPGNK